MGSESNGLEESSGSEESELSESCSSELGEDDYSMEMDWELDAAHKLALLSDNQKDPDFHPSREEEDEEYIDVD